MKNVALFSSWKDLYDVFLVRKMKKRKTERRKLFSLCTLMKIKRRRSSIWRGVFWHVWLITLNPHRHALLAWRQPGRYFGALYCVGGARYVVLHFLPFRSVLAVVRSHKPSMHTALFRNIGRITWILVQVKCGDSSPPRCLYRTTTVKVNYFKARWSLYRSEVMRHEGAIQNSPDGNAIVALISFFFYLRIVFITLCGVQG